LALQDEGVASILFIIFLSFSFSQLTNLDEFENLMDEGAYAKHCEEEEKHH
jgi:hypothetical protein